MINQEIGIDLGSNTTRIYVNNDDRIIIFKTVLAYDVGNNEIISLGDDSERIPHNITLKRPIKRGRIEDIELTVEMLKKALRDGKLRKTITNPNVLLSYDIDLSEVEKKALIDSVRELGVKNIYMKESIKLSALGIGMDISKQEGNMIIDMGYEVTRIGIILLDDIVEYKSISFGGNSFNEDIVNYLRKRYKVLVGETSSESIKRDLYKDKIIVEGRNVITNLPEKIEIDTREIIKLFNDRIDKLVGDIKSVLENINPEIFKDISNKGLVLTGGGSMISCLREELSKKLNMPVLEVVNPDTSVIDGIRRVIDEGINKGIKI